MGKKNRDKFARAVRDLANERGIRIGFIVYSDGDVTAGFTTYRNTDDAWEGTTVLKDLLEDIEDGDAL